MKKITTKKQTKSSISTTAEKYGWEIAGRPNEPKKTILSDGNKQKHTKKKEETKSKNAANNRETNKN